MLFDGWNRLRKVNASQHSLRVKQDDMHHLLDLLLIGFEYLLIEPLNSIKECLLLILDLLTAVVMFGKVPRM